MNSGTFNHHLDINLNYETDTMHEKGVAISTLKDRKDFKTFHELLSKKDFIVGKSQGL